jgi:hypothetical protein
MRCRVPPTQIRVRLLEFRSNGFKVVRHHEHINVTVFNGDSNGMRCVTLERFPTCLNRKGIPSGRDF